jgi:K(+)-stimulated pyrophosphate-energized sodium pump
MGVAPNALEAKGYGQEHPVADNSTEEGRALNRRISMLVTEK